MQNLLRSEFGRFGITNQMHPLEGFIQQWRVGTITPGGGGVTIIYEGTGCAIFWYAFFQLKINFGVSFLVKSQVVINFGVSF